MSLNKNDEENKRKIIENFEFELEYVQEVENFLEDLITSSLIEPDEPLEDFLLILREWNSYYPSFYDVNGGCYVISVDNAYTIVDPGYKTLKVLRENNIDTRLVNNIIITHNHGDHIGGILELIELIFKQKNKSQKPCRLFVNPGMLDVFEYYNSPSLEVIEINCNLKYYITLSNNLLFQAYPVPHTGIGLKQQSIALKFKYISKENDYFFAISSDLDGDLKYLNYYKEIFRDLEFLIVHLGSLKFKQSTNKDKHLYIDGILRLIKNVNSIKAFFVQEFGFEMKSPDLLSNDLSSVLFNPGYYFPLIVLKYSDGNPQLRKKLFPYLLPKFFDNLLDGDYNRKKTLIQEFSQSLCFKIRAEKSYIYDFWWSPNSLEIPHSEDHEDMIQKKWNNLFENFKKAFYFGTEVFDVNYLKNEIISIFNEILKAKYDSIIPELIQVIEDNVINLIELSKNVNEEKIEDFFSKSFWTEPSNSFLNDSEYLFLNYQSKFKPRLLFEKEIENPFYWSIYLPLLLFILEFKKSHRYSEKKQKNEWSDIRLKIVGFLKENSEKNVFLGTYKKKIYFKNITDEKLGCIGNEKPHEFQNPKDGKYYNSDNRIYCDACKDEYDFFQEEMQEAQANSIPYEDHEETEIWSELIKKKDEEERVNAVNIANSFSEFINNKEFKKAIDLIYEMQNIYFRYNSIIFDIRQDTVDILTNNKEDADVRKLVFHSVIASRGYIAKSSPNLLKQVLEIFESVLTNNIKKKSGDSNISIIKLLREIAENTVKLYRAGSKEGFHELSNIWDSFFERILEKLIKRINFIFEKEKRHEVLIEKLALFFEELISIYVTFPNQSKIYLRKIIFENLSYPKGITQLKSITDKFFRRSLFKRKSIDNKLVRIFEFIAKKS